MTPRKNSQSTISYRPSQNLPATPNYQTVWNLADLYYINIDDPRLLADVAYTERTYRQFAKNWRHRPFTTDSSTLRQALSEYETLLGDPRLTRPDRYLSLRLELDVTDSAAQKLQATLRKRLRNASDYLLFFTLELGKVTKSLQQEFLTDPNLAYFRYFLTCLFTNAKHDLTEAEEKIVRLKSTQASTLWQQMTDKLISTAEINWHKRSIPLPEALEMIEALPSKQKPELWDAIITKIDTFGIPAEHEFNAIITDIRTEDSLRGYKKPYSATTLNYEHDEKSIEALVTAVSDRGFALSQRFYKLKAKYHGVPKLHYAQKYDSLGTEPNIPFATALEICRDIFYRVNQLYGRIFDDMLERGQLDIFPRKGKRGGAFMSDQTGHPIQVLLNHTNTLKALETLAHEMGHAVHAARSATQSPLYDGHSIVTAETASTLFESLVFQALKEQASDDEKLLLLHDRLTRDIATMQRQIAFFNCELEIHTTIEREGAMTHAELKQCMHRHLTSYLGPAVDVRPIDGASYVYIPHLRYGFYVYSYTFGHLMSSLMAAAYKADTSYSKQIDTFLSAGSSASVVQIFKRIGLNTTKADTFLSALTTHENDIKQFEKLVKRKR